MSESLRARDDEAALVFDDKVREPEAAQKLRVDRQEVAKIPRIKKKKKLSAKMFGDDAAPYVAPPAPPPPPAAPAAPAASDDGDGDGAAPREDEAVEYDELEVARMNSRLKGVEFEDDGDMWKVLKVSFDAEHEEMVCFYYDAGFGDDGTLVDCEYSGVDQVLEWISVHQKSHKRR